MSLSAEAPPVLRPPYDPAILVALKAFENAGFGSLDEIRAQAIGSAETVLEKFPNLGHTEHTLPTINDSTGHMVTLSVFKSASSTNTSRPAVYIVHGGGQIAGNRFTTLPAVLEYFEPLDIVAVTVEYRLAPEHPAPAALDDAYAGLIWTADNAAKLGIDPTKIMVLGGSGGAPIAAGCALLAHRNQSPKLRAQMLLTPMIDDRGETVSAKQYENVGPWCGATNLMAWDWVLGSARGGPDVSELVAPARATDLTGLPPTFIDAGEAEVFRDEAVAYASKLWKFGVSAELHVWKGAFHGFDLMSGDSPVARSAVAAKISWIKRVFELGE
ncbi:Alpha/beta hydrolase fold-3 [Penicillium concentricum]|uniref:Alpha/beta hydrolase fold-3 n=1 Tax=Penicillium concentricum TaxID=293559 RepID=A0A9W9SS49_9EURO|nr:Alpha/beta hydrolase fold-3 [Penicillium concentricum]KAJ5383585.1 Alpha/beta hydrolase fold-3 [Penicillium concentricum]